MTETGDFLQLYMSDVERIPLLTGEEEISLSIIRESGEVARIELVKGVDSEKRKKELEQIVVDGEAAYTKLVESNLKLVVSIAGKYRNRGISDLDLIQEGNIGLQIGVSKYNWRMGYKLSSYIYWWIRREILMAINQQSRIIRLPANITNNIYRIRQVENGAEEGEEISLEDISSRTGMDIDTIEKMKAVTFNTFSMNSVSYNSDSDDKSISIEDMISNELYNCEDIVENKFSSIAIDESMHRVLTEREIKVIGYRYGIIDGKCYSLLETGKILGITRQRVGQLEIEAIEKMKDDQELRRFFSGDEV